MSDEVRKKDKHRNAKLYYNKKTSNFIHNALLFSSLYFYKSLSATTFIINTTTYG